MWINVISAIGVLVGVLFVFDARRITKKNFASTDENKITLGIKILGALLILIFGMWMFMNIK